MKQILLLLIIFFMLISKSNANEPIPELKIYMEVWAPFQYKDENNTTQGFSVDLLDLVLKDLDSTNSKKDFQFTPWSRSISNLQNANTIVFSMIKTPERENSYQWVGPIYDVANYVIVKNDSLLNEESFTPGNNITAASITDDASLHCLNNLKINQEHITLVSNMMSPIRMLNNNRVDIIVDNWFNFTDLAQKAGLKSSDFKKLINLGSHKTYFAISKSTDPSISLKLQNSMDKIKATAQYPMLLKKYNLDIKTKRSESRCPPP